jgi:hypothetical protein
MRYIYFLTILTLFAPHLAKALTFNSPLGNINSFETLTTQIITSVIGAASVLAVISFLYGGWLWFFSRDDTKLVEKSKLVMIWSVAGLGAILLSYGVVNLFLTIMEVK